MKNKKVFSLKYKILSTIFIVFILMGGASIWSMHKLKEINKEVDNLAKVIIPINNTIAEIEMEILKQQNICSSL